ncbi:turripeptide Pal9.2-like [Mya arenaria]|uniref:turripeptide Pal9.2-like n=1 Tax=Mya arenaria TaxID=6604 RepID=UPI0022E851F6|nr:turripeptide Pal9.2-like [Mya arenaria]
MKIILCLAFLSGCLGASLNFQCGEFCIDGYLPVCGSNGKTYPNLCYFQQAKCLDPTLTSYAGPCGTTYYPPCPDMMCMALYDPVCGSDRKTYSNKCELHAVHCHGEVSVAHTGTCSGTIPPV